ncbi:MAG: TSUP family transporter [Phycisphaerae bacterium]
MPELHILIPILFAAGLAAGLVDSVAGGGGLITVPVLLAVGLPPKLALGTNKFQASFGSCTAAITYVRGGKVDLRAAALGVAITFLAAVAGAVTVQLLDSELLGKIIPLAMVGILAYVLIVPKLGEVDTRPRMNRGLFYLLSGVGIGFYDGFFGPGTGSFWTMAFMVLLGFNMTRAVGHTKVMNFTSNIAALLFFVLGGNVDVVLGVSMAAGQVIGARIGAGLVLRKGVKFIRPVFIVVVFLTTVKLVWDNFVAEW